MKEMFGAIMRINHMIGFRKRHVPAFPLLIAGIFIAVAISSLPYHVSALDGDFIITFEPTLRATHAGVNFYNGNPANPDVEAPPVTIRASELTGTGITWEIEQLAPWPDDAEEVLPGRGVYAIARYNLVSFEPDEPAVYELDGPPVRGENFDVVNAHWSRSETNTITADFHMPPLGTPDAKSGIYRLVFIVMPESKSVYDPVTDTSTVSPMIADDIGRVLADEENFYADLHYFVTIQFEYIADVDHCREKCYSNVLFIPGIKASRLYVQRGEGCMLNCEDQLWEPNADGDVEDLFLHPDGTSVRDDVYTRDILDEYFAPGNSDVYKTFSDFMTAQAESGVINEWRAIPYDWRLDLEHAVLNGTFVDGRLSYIGAATSSYAIGQLEALAANSKSGKVTIIAHSNGGLFAKILMEELERAGKTGLVDKIIFIGVPQTGTPKAIATLLHGYDEALLAGLITKTSTARQLAENLPGAYNLLPSTKYFDDVATPPVEFSPDAVSAEGVRAAYGDGIETYQELNRFLLGLEGRDKPATDDTNEPNILNGSLLARAEELHARLDSWVPPEGVELIKLAGVGIQTPVQFVYVDDCSIWCVFSDPSLGYEPTMVIEGDGTVVDASAIAGPGETYYFNLKSYNAAQRLRSSVEHSTMMGASAVNDFIQRTLRAEAELPPSITTTKPSFESEKHLRYRVHSPVTLDVYDNSGNHTGIATTTLSDGTVVRFAGNNVPGTRYDEFGEVKYVYSDGSTPVRVVLDGQDTGYATFDIAETAGNTISTSTTYTNIPIEPRTIITMNVSAGSTLAGASGLRIDNDGDGTTDVELPVGDVVNYGDFVLQAKEETEKSPVSEPPPASQGGGGGTIVGLIGTVASSSGNGIAVATTTLAESYVSTSDAPASRPAATTSATQVESHQKPSSVAVASKLVKQAPKNSVTKPNNATLVAGAAVSVENIFLKKSSWRTRLYQVFTKIYKSIF